MSAIETVPASLFSPSTRESEVVLRNDPDPPVPPTQTPPAPVTEPPDSPTKEPDAPVQEPGPTPPKRY